MNLNSNSSCGCGKSGSDKGTPAAALNLAIASVPMQAWEQPYEPASGLQHGTIFPCLDLPFYVTGGEK